MVYVLYNMDPTTGRNKVYNMDYNIKFLHKLMQKPVTQEENHFIVQ